MHRITLNGRALREAASEGGGPGLVCRIVHEGRISECHQLSIIGPARLVQGTDHDAPDPLWLETKAALVQRSGAPMMLPRKRGAIIHVNRALLGRNRSKGTDHPCITIKTMDGRTRYGRAVRFEGPLHLVNDGRQLHCGARAWFTTWAPIEIEDEMSFAEANSSAHAQLTCPLETCS